MSREMMVGGEHMVSGRHRDYDDLMEMGGEVPSTALARRPMHTPPVHIQHYPQQHHVPQHYPPPPAQVYYIPQPTPVHAPAPPAPAPVQEQEAPRRRHLVKEEPTRERQFPIGFTHEDVQPNQEVEIEAKPQVYFRGERLAISPRIAGDFQIVDIRVGKNSQLAAIGPMPGDAFSALAVGVRMELDTAKEGIVISLRVRNVSSQPSTFSAVLYGAVLE